MSTEPQQGPSPEERPSGEPVPPEGAPDGAFGHSGQGAQTALTRMKQWERSRAQLGSDAGGERPLAG